MQYREQLVWYLLAGTKGGRTRAKIILALKRRPYNAHQLSSALNLDYKTIRHHLRILLENRLIVRIGKEDYGAPYALSEYMNLNFEKFKDIWKRLKDGDRLISGSSGAKAR